MWERSKSGGKCRGNQRSLNGASRKEKKNAHISTSEGGNHKLSDDFCRTRYHYTAPVKPASNMTHIRFWESIFSITLGVHFFGKATLGSIWKHFLLVDSTLEFKSRIKQFLTAS